MLESIEAFPLQWPYGFERSKIKKSSQFQCTLAEARDGVLNQIRLLKGTNVVISSSIPLLKNGQMQGSGRPVDGDHGVAVYFTWKGEQFVFACDTYHYVWDNLRGIEHTIDSIRRIERHGASDMLKRAFSGFKALPEAKSNWWVVLGVKPFSNITEIKFAYKELIKQYHPDNPDSGNEAEFLKIQKAYAEAMKYDKA